MPTLEEIDPTVEEIGPTVEEIGPTLVEIAQGSQNIKACFISISQHIAESRHVIDELSKEDPPTEPFKSKYAGRDMLKTALERAQNFQPFTEQEISRIRMAQATIFYYIGQVSTEVEEPLETEKSLLSAIDLLDLEPVSKFNLSLRLHIHNVLATLWSGRAEHSSAHALLEIAKAIHAEYQRRKEPPPHSYDEIFMDEEFTSEERSAMYESLYANTQLYLEQERVSRDAESAEMQIVPVRSPDSA